MSKAARAESRSSRASSSPRRVLLPPGRAPHRMPCRTSPMLPRTAPALGPGCGLSREPVAASAFARPPTFFSQASISVERPRSRRVIRGSAAPRNQCRRAPERLSGPCAGPPATAPERLPSRDERPLIPSLSSLAGIAAPGAKAVQDAEGAAERPVLDSPGPRRTLASKRQRPSPLLLRGEPAPPFSPPQPPARLASNTARWSANARRYAGRASPRAM